MTERHFRPREVYCVSVPWDSVRNNFSVSSVPSAGREQAQRREVVLNLFLSRLLKKKGQAFGLPFFQRHSQASETLTQRVLNRLLGVGRYRRSSLALHECDLVASFVVRDFVHEGPHQQHATAVGTSDIFRIGRIGKLADIEARAFIADHKLNLFC